ncbi:MAG: metal-dependent transcriptional regulator [Methanophagales archaeon]|nr:metal-dependent transcriptional regulator [Methanophagales archaeon]MCW3142075.1 metal-dependent transcriptional regulator [Methanophagales archaeon]
MLSRKGEDYLEAILNIAEKKGYARIKDIALALGVTPSSVVEMVKRLNDLGFVEYRKYDGVTLTPRGKEIGKAVWGRHTMIRAFLEIIKVPEKIANKDACIIEHELDPKTIEQVKNLVNFVQSAPDYPQWLEHFEIFCKTGVHPCDEGKRKEREHRLSS